MEINLTKRLYRVMHLLDVEIERNQEKQWEAAKRSREMAVYYSGEIAGIEYALGLIRNSFEESNLYE